MGLKHFGTFLILLLFLGFNTFSQQKIEITGKLLDIDNRQPIPYATVIAKDKNEDHIITGTTTNDDGAFNFEISSKNFHLEISFIGYKKKIINDIPLSNNPIELGEILLEKDAEMLNEVEVKGEKSTLEFKLDKKVFNVGKDITSTGAGAADVLNNVPSVNVDIEGQISLRGNTGVQILINGKPSVLSDDGINALNSITADMIESIEVITNPSAKYEAGGTAGIINIVLKKEEKKGTNGSVSVNTGIPHNHSLGFSLNHRTEDFNFFTQFGAGYRSLPRYNENYNENTITGFRIESDGVNYRNEDFYNIRLGTDYYINRLNVITLSGNFALELENQPSENNFLYYDNAGELISKWVRNEITTAVNPKYQYDLQYKREFKDNEDHVLLISTLGKFFGKDQQSEFNTNTLQGAILSNNQETETNFYRADYIGKLDYTHPINKQITYEGGAQYELNDVGNEYAVFDVLNSSKVQDFSLSNNFQYVQQVLGVYSTASYEGSKWGIKLGTRAENTVLKTSLVTTNEENDTIYTNFFPTAHASYKISQFFSLQSGYSRRIYRPRLWDLNPFFNIRNNFNIQMGNPNLLPELADSYELTGIFVFEKFFVNTSLYYLFKQGVIERVSISDGNVTVTTPRNIGTSGKKGLELNTKVDVTKKISLNGDFNYGFFTRKGEFEGQNFDFQGDQWSSKLTGKLKLPADFDVEISGFAESKYKTVQGTRSGFVALNTGVRKKIAKGKLIASFNVRDVFASRIRENFAYQNDSYLYNFSKRGRFITLGISYSFGKGEAMAYTGRRH